MKVAVLGNTGMLGHVVEKVFKLSGMEVSGFNRSALDIFPRKLNDVGTKLSSLLGFDTDYVINCIGAIKPTFDAAVDYSVPIYTNAVFPHQLATWGQLTDTKVIHITTDCVFSGDKGGYTEFDLHDATDPYGQSKSLGEPQKTAMVIRTSIFGPEREGRRRSLLEWIKLQNNKKVNGFINHYWNGLTTLELANCLLDIVVSDLWDADTFHVFSEDITKYEMLVRIIRKYGLNTTVERYECPTKVDRTLRTVQGLNGILQPVNFGAMLDELFLFEHHL